MPADDVRPGAIRQNERTATCGGLIDCQLELTAVSRAPDHKKGSGAGVTSARRRKYRVVFERDESGAWIARVPSVPGCHTYGRTIDQARRRIREALGLWVEGAEKAELVEDVRLPARAEDALRRSTRARAEAERRRQQAHAATTRTAKVLVEDLQLSLRDAGELLGLSYQRVLQLVRDPRRDSERGRR